MAKTQVTIDVLPLVPIGDRDRPAVEKALEPYGTFIGLPLRIRWP